MSGDTKTFRGMSVSDWASSTPTRNLGNRNESNQLCLDLSKIEPAFLYTNKAEYTQTLERGQLFPTGQRGSFFSPFLETKAKMSRHMHTHGCVLPYGVLRVCLAVDADAHWDRELGQPLAELDRFLFVPTVEGITQGEGQFLRCTGSRWRGLIYISPQDVAHGRSTWCTLYRCHLF